MVAFVPSVVQITSIEYTLALLSLGILIFTLSEYYRLSGRNIPLISTITKQAMRERDQGHFVFGPVTLALGAMLALSFYPEPAASAGIYALAFGDGFASLIGRLFGKIKIPFLQGKSLEGSLACFIAVFIALSTLISGITPLQALVLALGASVLEALPTKDLDNLIIPMGTGFLTVIVLSL